MNAAELTDHVPLARSLPMQRTSARSRVRDLKVAVAVAMLAGGSTLVGGCVSVNAPDKPIVIELNINIRQEVIYRLAQDAEKTIDQNPEIF